MNNNNLRFVRTLCDLSPEYSQRINHEIHYHEKKDKYLFLEEKLNIVLDVEKKLLERLERNAKITHSLKGRINDLETDLQKKNEYSKEEADHFYKIIHLEKKLELMQQKCTNMAKDEKVDAKDLIALRKKIIKIRDKVVTLKTLYSP